MTAPSYAAAPLLDRDPVITRLYHAWEQASEGSAEEAAAETALGAALRTVVKRAAWVARYLASALRRASRRTEPAVADRRSVARSAPPERGPA